jgi:hypothetical protein
MGGASASQPNGYTSAFLTDPSETIAILGELSGGLGVEPPCGGTISIDGGASNPIQTDWEKTGFAR